VTTPAERATRVQARVNQIQAHRDIPLLSDQIREVVRISQDEDAALDRLADLVIANYGLTLRVLRTVNSIHYNRSGQPILSITRAIVLLGVRTVREMATSFLVLDHYQKRSPELKQLMILSMVTASHAERLTSWTTRVRPDEAYVCGMFRNLGEVLIAYHFPADYASILQQMEAAGISGGEAAFRLLGFGYEDLGAAMARHWGMPVAGDGMLPMGTSSGLRAVTELGHLLTGAVYRAPRPPTEEELVALVDRYRADIAIPPSQIAALLHGAAADVRKLFASLGSSPDELTLLERGERPDPAPALAPTPEPDGYRLGSIRETRDRLLAEVETVTVGGEFDLNRALLVVLEAMQRGGPFDRALLGLVDRDGAVIRGRLALGPEAEALSAAFHFPLGSQTAIATALMDREPTFLTRATFGARDARIAKQLGAAEFGVLPLVIEGHAIGCLYCDRRSVSSGPDPATLMFLGRVQTIAEQAIAASRRPAVPAVIGTESRRSG